MRGEARKPHGRILVVTEESGKPEALISHLEAAGHPCSWSRPEAYRGDSTADRRPDLIILTLERARAGAVRTVKRLREAGSAPVVVVASQGSSSDRAAALEAGAEDAITWPYSFRELTARIEAALRRAQEPGGLDVQIVRTGSLVVDPVAERGWRGERELSLTPHESRLLMYFAENPAACSERQNSSTPSEGTTTPTIACCARS